MTDTIINSFDIWLDAQGIKSRTRVKSVDNISLEGIDRLREIILELAIRGKLVPQDTNDEPASKLLERIEVEKKRLIKEGEINVTAYTLEVNETDRLFDLPVGWEWTKIRNIGHDWGQKTPDVDFSYIDVSAIDNLKGILISPTILKASEAPSRARKIVKYGTVIYSTIRPYLKNICVISEEYLPKPIASTAFAIIHPYLLMPGEFFYIYFRSPIFVNYVESVQTGIAYPAINDKQFFGGMIPLPPVAEQHRIIAKVNELMALCNQLEEEQFNNLKTHQILVKTVLETLTKTVNNGKLQDSWRHLSFHFDTLFSTEDSIEQLKQTVLQLAVMGKLVKQDHKDESAAELIKKIAKQKEKLIKEGKIKGQKSLPKVEETEQPFKIPAAWVWTRLGEITVINPRNVAEDTSQASFIPMNLITASYTGEHGSEQRKWGDIKQGFTHFADGDIGVAKITPCFENSKAAVFSNLTNGIGAGTTELHIARPYGRTLNARFVLFNLKTPEYLKNGELKMTGTAGQKRLPKNFFEEYPFPLPPLAEQSRIVSKVDELFALCDALKEKIQKSQDIKVLLSKTVVENAIQ